MVSSQTIPASTEHAADARLPMVIAAAHELAAATEAALEAVAAAIAAGTAPSVAVKSLGKLISEQANILRRYSFDSMTDISNALQLVASSASLAAVGSTAEFGPHADIERTAASAARALSALQASQRRWSDALAQLDAAAASAAAVIDPLSAVADAAKHPLAEPSPHAASPAALLRHGVILPQFTGTLLRCAAHAAARLPDKPALCCSAVTAAPFSSRHWFSSSPGTGVSAHGAAAAAGHAAASAGGVAGAARALSSQLSGAEHSSITAPVHRHTAPLLPQGKCASTLLVFLRHAG